MAGQLARLIPTSGLQNDAVPLIEPAPAQAAADIDLRDSNDEGITIATPANWFVTKQ